MKQITWNLKQLFDGDGDPRIEEKRKIVEQKSYAFIDIGIIIGRAIYKEMSNILGTQSKI